MTWYEEIVEETKSRIVRGLQNNPTLFLRGGDGHVAAIDLSIIPNKGIMRIVMTMLIEDADPEEYLFITEAFVKELDQHDKSEEALGRLVADGTLQVSELPSSHEAIIALHGTRIAEKLGFVVFRKSERGVEFQPIRWLKGEDLKGRFADLRR